jgi:hypothetical protein
MNQFGYRPPSAGRSLIRNSEEKIEQEIVEDELEEIEGLEEQRILKKIRALIVEYIAATRAFNFRS